MDGRIKFLDEGRENPLVQKPLLLEAALDEFSVKPFHDANINSILKQAKMNKGSFYFKFYDKLDLYLCLFEKVGLSKLQLIEKEQDRTRTSAGFFEQLRAVAAVSLEFAKQNKRLYGLWHQYMGESSEHKKIVLNAFPAIGQDFIRALVQEGIASGELSNRFTEEFICRITTIFFQQMGAFVDRSMTEDEIMEAVDQLKEFMKYGLCGDSVPVKQLDDLHNRNHQEG